MSIKPAILTTKAIKVKETTSKVHTHYERDTDANMGTQIKCIMKHRAMYTMSS